MRYVDIVDNLKVRLGYGLAGNQGGISSYTTMNLAKPNGVTPVGNLPMVTFETLRNVNPNLKWEVKKTFNAGADLEMYGSRLILSVNYYKSKTSDMLYNYHVSVPPFTSLGGFWQGLYLHDWGTNNNSVLATWEYLYKSVMLCNESVRRIRDYAAKHSDDDTRPLMAEVKV